MNNADIARVFSEMADMMEIVGGEDRYRIRAFRRTARVLEQLPEPVAVLLRRSDLAKTPGIGEGSLGRIKDILRTGTCGDHRRLSMRLPPGLRELYEIKGLGGKTIRLLYNSLRISSVDQLEQAARAGRLAALPGFGGQTVERLLRSIEVYRRDVGRTTLDVALTLGEQIIDSLRELEVVEQTAVGGSARRRKPTIGDLDIVVAAEEAALVVDRFCRMDPVEEVLVRGDHRASVRLDTGRQVDLVVRPSANWGAALCYFTGSELHNIALRARGNRMGLELSDKGVFLREDHRLLRPGRREEEIYQALGLPWIPPEIRENTGEIEIAEQGRLPRLLEPEDVDTDWHVYSEYSGGVEAAVLLEAAERLGRRRLVFTDRVDMLDEHDQARADRLRAQGLRFGVEVMVGLEVDIDEDGVLMADPRRLEAAEWVLARLPPDADNGDERIARAIASGRCHCVAHPTGRRLPPAARESERRDLDRILRLARKHEVALELNADPRCLDLDAVSCRQAKTIGVKIAIGTGARTAEQLEWLRFGLYTARRGWLSASDLVATEGPGHRDRPVATVRADSDLVSQLAQTPLDPGLRQRLERFLRDGDDETLERALRAASDNPIQAAFALLART